MKRYGNLWDKVISYENILLAYNKAKKGKNQRRQVKVIEENREIYLKELQNQLIKKTYRTSEYKIKKIFVPKEREIFILPFYPDRIVQHALMNIVAPIWDNMFIHDSYACRQFKGQHRASKKLMGIVRNKEYYFQGDIKKFYPSITHEILLKIVTKKIKDKDVLWLLKDIIYSMPSGKNVPIGNYTSQWLGNLYLNELDMFIKHKLQIKHYLRYNDDFVILHNDKKLLFKYQESIRKFLKDTLNLILSKEKIRPMKLGIDFIGYRHFKEKILIRKTTVKRVKKRIKQLTKNILIIKKESIISSVNSTLGWLKWANTYNLQKKLNLQELLRRAA